jgi:hypothetical protein
MPTAETELQTITQDVDVSIPESIFESILESGVQPASPSERNRRSSPTYRMMRPGEFTVTLDESSPCYAQGLTTFKYEIRLESRKLDARGFIVDSFAVPAVFDRYQSGVWSGPCEALATDAARDLIDQNPSLTFIQVTVRTPNGTEIGVEWRRGDLRPNRRMQQVQAQAATWRPGHSGCMGVPRG